MNLDKFVLTQLDPEVSLKVPTYTIYLYGTVVLSSCNFRFKKKISLFGELILSSFSSLRWTDKIENCWHENRSKRKEDSEISQLSQQNLQWIRQIQYNCKQFLAVFLIRISFHADPGSQKCPYGCGSRIPKMSICIRIHPLIFY